MDSKPKTGSTAKRPAKAEKTEPEKTQRERFIDAAREVGVDETGTEFESAIKKIVKK